VKELNAVAPEPPGEQELTVQTVSRPGNAAEFRRAVASADELPIDPLAITNEMEFLFALNR
jgi:hypothetical protein